MEYSGRTLNQTNTQHKHQNRVEIRWNKFIKTKSERHQLSYNKSHKEMWDFSGVAHHGQPIIVYIWDGFGKPLQHQSRNSKARSQKVSHKLYHIWRSLVDVRVAGAAHRGQPIIVYLGRIWNLSSHPIQSDPAKKSQKSKFKHDVRCYCLLARQLDMRANTY